MLALVGLVFVVLWFLSTAVFELPAPVGQALLTLALASAAAYLIQQFRRRRPPR